MTSGPLRILPLLAALALATGCIVHPSHRHRAGGHHHHHHHEVGPPDHAPAHGYRRKHPGDHVELVYDAEIGVYVVVGRSGVYWDGTRYLAWHEGAWRVAARIDGVWVGVAVGEVPERLVARHGGGVHPGKGPKKARGPKKPHPHDHDHDYDPVPARQAP